ncbi:CD63 antigen-like [Haliotis rufescens]|uniref:CD63 antigen-like n=1 Tax=Haliotis rufescens TaxID=6454 RepID=UPI001EB03D47|nr:CD63 antigen-like [Haliotis rufescens]
MEGGMKIVKVLLMVFNIIFVIVGCALIGVGAYVQTQLTDVASIFGSEYNGPGILLIFVGVIIFLIAAFGCLGACRENHCCIMTFAGLLVVIFILEIGGGIAGFVLRDQIESTAVEKMEKAQGRYNSSQDVREGWKFIQQSFKCCGADNYTSWERYLPKPPESCCKSIGSIECQDRSFTNTGDIYTKSCTNGIIDWLKQNVILLGGIGIGLAFVQVFGICLACCLGKAIKKEYEVV